MKHSSTNLKTRFGEFRFHCFSWGLHEEDNILVLENDQFSGAPLVRVQSACYSAEIFRSLDCDCHAQLSKSQRLIAENGGYLIYMLCDGRGAGLLNKLRGMALGEQEGLDTSDAYRKLGLLQDPREYLRVSEVIKHFRLEKIQLLTNNPRKIEGLTSAGIDVDRVPLEIDSTEDTKPYLETKAKKMGHLLSEFGQ
ncbi:GTP cyclohydrolase II [Chrysiogenes arsenatis]|uniref:GTP cyclohydrolase II n=1 Tax=Chrysiogenes arsenatis TaxID=309797 RepID=UPI000685E600|nr:GTP cyclohydrolase II [Chrysiogenes arsenatis]